MSSRLWQETRALAEDYLSFCCSSRWLAPRPPSEPAAAMRHLAEDAERQNQATMHSMALRLRQLGGDPCSALRGVMTELSADGHLNWGRVVSIFTFAGVVAKQLREQGGGPREGPREGAPAEEQRSGGLAAAIADYLADEKRDWMLEHNGWDGFCEFYQRSPSAKHSPVVKTALYAAAGGVGLGLTLLAARKMSTFLLNVLFHVLVPPRSP